LQDDFAGDPDGSFVGIGPAPVAASSITFQSPSAGPGAYSVVFFRNGTEPVPTDLVPPVGAILARFAFTILPPEAGIATFNPAAKIPPDTGDFIAGSQGLACPAGSIGRPDPNGIKGGWSPCPLCPLGSFNAIYSATSCTLCPPGQVTFSAGAQECSACPTDLVAGSQFLLPENIAACSACGFCCTNACRAAVTAPVITAVESESKRTTPKLRLNTTAAKQTTDPPSTTVAQADMQTEKAGGPTDVPQTTGANMWSGICGNRMRELYYTDCWYAFCP
jgi:hypothetical protein